MTAMAVAACGEIASIHLRDLGDITFDARELLCAIAQFKFVGEIKAYLRLKLSLRMRGALPTGISSLARIAQVGPKAFERMAPDLGCYFDRTEEGRWTDHRIVQSRDRRYAVLPPVEVDAGKSAKMAANGSKGGLVTQARKRAREMLGAGEIVAAVEGGGEIAGGFAPAVDTSFEANKAEFASTVVANRQADNGAWQANGGAPVSKLASSTDEYESKPASGARPREAGAGAKCEAEPVDPRPSLEANRRANPIAAEPRAPSDAEMIEAIERACDGKVTKAEAYGRLPVFRAAMAEGVDFVLDILPKLEGFARRNAHVENCANKHVLEDARVHAAARQAVAKIPTAMVKVYRDDPAHADILDAVLARLGRRRTWFTQHDGGGYHAHFRRVEWEAALAAARKDGAGA